MATWRAEVFVNSQVGRINTEVEAATFSGAKQQIYARHGDVQQIVNLRQVNNGSSGGDSISGSGSVWLVGLIGASAVFLYLTPWVLMLLGGAGGAWITQKCFGKTIEEACDEENKKVVAWILSVAMILGGTGFVYGSFLHKDLMTKYGSDNTEQVK
jgi:uncharacterized protein YneF (UPF0154 family)